MGETYYENADYVTAREIFRMLLQKFPNADYIDKAGFFIGLHTKQIKSKTLKYLSNELLKF